MRGPATTIMRSSGSRARTIGQLCRMRSHAYAIRCTADHQAVAVVLDLVQPPRSARRGGHLGRQAGIAKAMYRRKHVAGVGITHPCAGSRCAPAPAPAPGEIFGNDRSPYQPTVVPGTRICCRSDTVQQNPCQRFLHHKMRRPEDRRIFTIGQDE
jgi:hypothetical protein